MPQPVLFMIQHLDHGGSEFHFQELVSRLDRGRFQPHVIYANGGVVTARLEQLGGLPLTRIPIGRAYDLSGLRAIGRVRHYLRENRIAAIVSFHFVADFVCALAAFGGAGTPVISSRRDTGFTRTSRQIRMGRWLAPRVTRYIAVSEAVREAVARDEAVDPARIEVIHNGLDIAALDARRWDLAAERARHGLTPDDYVIGCVANFNPVKRHLTLLEAFARLCRERPERPLRLLLTGDGPMRPAIESRIRELAIKNRVILAGRSPQITPDYAVADVFVLPSETEGFSNAIVQAMAYRRPVIACRVGGNPEAVADGETGLLVPANDPTALADALDRLAGDPELRRRMGEAGRDRAERLFTLDRMVDRTQAVIDEVIRR